MVISHQIFGSKGAFVAKENNIKIGEMTYSKLGDDKIIINHTQVGVDQKGKGIGMLLLDKVVEMAREEQVKIIPLCPFAAAMFRKHTNIQDVLSN